MSKAARAIIIEDGRMLVMHRNKYGSQYYTLVGGRVHDDETTEVGLVREIQEETGLKVTKQQLIFFEKHPAPYNEQYIYLCEVAPHGEVALEADSEEAMMNRMDMNNHTPVWVPLPRFASLPFRTPQLQAAIVEALKRGWPTEPKQI